MLPHLDRAEPHDRDPVRQRRAWQPDRDRVGERSLYAQTYIAEVELLSRARREVLGMATETGEMAQFYMLDTPRSGSGCRFPGPPLAGCWSRI